MNCETQLVFQVCLRAPGGVAVSVRGNGVDTLKRNVRSGGGRHGSERWVRGEQVDAGVDAGSLPSPEGCCVLVCLGLQTRLLAPSLSGHAAS